MLIDFTFENYSSFKDEYTFNMKKDKGNEFEEINTFNTKYGELLKSSILFGANASGKTNFIKALQSMKFMVLYSALPINVIKSIESFKFVKQCKNIPTKFEINMVIEDVEYIYGFEILNNEVNKEWLKRRVEKLTFLFNRKSSDCNNTELFSDFSSEKKILSKVNKNTLFIGIATMFNNSIAKKITDWFNNLNIFINLKYDDVRFTVEYLQENPIVKSTILKYLKAADIDIEDFEFDLKDLDTDIEDINKLKNNLLKESNGVKVDIMAKTRQLSGFVTKHKLYDEYGNMLNETMDLSFKKYQSTGTKKFFSMLGPIFKTLDCGGILVIDEIDSMLHCAIVRLILRMFNSLDINKNNAQLICTTHDVLLLEEDIRRDQIWFVEKNDISESELYCLSEFIDVRKNDNLLKKYLLGMFGAIPFKRGEI